MMENGKNDDFQIPPIKREALEEAHQEHLVKVNHQNPEPPLRGETFLRKLDLWILKVIQSLVVMFDKIKGFHSY